MIQYIASDVRQNLLSGHATTLNPELFDIIRQLKEHGIHFIAASDHEYKNLQRLFAPVKDDISYVAENGSMCVHDGKIVSLGHIDTDLIYEIADAAKEYGHCHTLISTQPEPDIPTQKILTTSIISVTMLVMTWTLFKMCVISKSLLSKSPYVILTELKNVFAPIFKNVSVDRIKIVTSGNIWIDFIAPNANKGSALSNIVSSLGMDPKNGITFGDQYNDLEMFSCPTQAMP